jgi:phasin
MSELEQKMSEFEQKSKATAEKSVRAVEQSYLATVDNMRDYIIKMIDMAQANTETVFELARQLASAKAPSDFAEVWTALVRKQYEMLSEQAKELTALGQKMAGESAQPIERNIEQAFAKAS